MQISCNQDTFSKYLNITSRILTGKHSMPVLDNILLEAKKGKLLLTTTDLEIGIHCWLGADVHEEGCITVPGKQLAEYVNTLPAD